MEGLPLAPYLCPPAPWNDHRLEAPPELVCDAWACRGSRQHPGGRLAAVAEWVGAGRAAIRDVQIKMENGRNTAVQISHCPGNGDGDGA